MYREKSLLVLIVCLLSIFFVQHTSYSHGDHDAINRAKIDVENSERYMDRAVKNYNGHRVYMETLISQWMSNKINKQKYIDSTSTVRSSMNATLNDVNTAYSIGGTLVIPETKTDGTLTGETISVKVKGYINDYKTYLSAGAVHLGETYESLFPKVQQNTGKVDSHSFLIVSTYRHWDFKPLITGLYTWKTWGLPNNEPLISHQANRKRLKNTKMIWGVATFIILIIGVSVLMLITRR